MMKSGNHLRDETSPYLLQHAHNPVHWHPWGPEALALAVAAQKPILLSIGYSACHWCHVMERESFENDAIAALMNASFVCIKVDREERPDLDAVYMAATTSLNEGRGGWPMTVFLTPNQEPFFAGTYFPPEDRHGMPGFPRLLRRIAELWEVNRDVLVEQAAEITRALRQHAAQAPSSVTGLDDNDLRQAVLQLAEQYDPPFGGFSPAPKFPHTTSLHLLLLWAHEHPGEGSAAAMAAGSLNGMAHGGLMDHLAGGFARYSTDAAWLVPHFEKMLYDNALLARVYVQASQVLHEPFYAEVARATLDWVLSDLTDPAGGFYSAWDADSAGVEGRYYVWQLADLHRHLSAPQAQAFAAWYDVTEAGNWEGQSILHTPRPWATVAAELNLTVPQLQSSIAASKAILQRVRQQRVAPACDDKIITAWNGLMLSALAQGAQVLGETRYLQAGVAAAAFLRGALVSPTGALWRTWRRGRAHLAGCLEDYAFLCEGLVDLYEAGASKDLLDWAAQLGACLVEDFFSDGAFYDTPKGHEPLLMRMKEGHDGAMPNAHATAAHTLARLAVHLDKASWRQVAAAALQTYAARVRRTPSAFCRLLVAADFVAHTPTEISVLGDPKEAAYQALWRAANMSYVPRKVLAHGRAADPAMALLAGKDSARQPVVYLCQNASCGPPLTEPAAVTAAFLLATPKSGTRRDALK